MRSPLTAQFKQFQSKLKDARVVDVHSEAFVSILQVTGQVPCLILEYVEGVSLAQVRNVARPHRRIEPGFALLIADRIASALQVMHEDAQLVHCDVKPSNVLISFGGILYLNDLGIATRVGGNAPSFAARGCWPPEMMPEQNAAMPPVRPTLDVYSLGVLLYDCLTGEPYARTAETEPLVGPVQLPGTPVDSLADCLRAFEHKDDLIRVVLGCLEPNPTERYRSMKQVRKDLTPLVPSRNLADLVAPFRTAPS